MPKDEDITKKEFHPVSRCNTCRHKLIRKTTTVFYEEDISLPIQKIVTKHTVEKGYCPRCNQPSVGLDLPSAKVILGKQTKIYICYLSLILNLSFEKIRQILKDTYNLKISDGETSRILEKESVKLRPEYERRKEGIARAWILSGIYPSRDLTFKVGDKTYYAVDALEKMAEPISTEGVNKTFETGIEKPLEIK